MKDVHTLIDDVLRREGGFVDHPADRGGPTKYGITMPALTEFRGRPVTGDDIRNLTEEEARRLYRDRYLTRPNFHRITDPYLRALVFDSGVNHGTQTVTRWLQRSVGVADDGIFGDATEVAVNSADSVRVFQRVLARRVRFYGELISRDPELRRARRAGFALQAEFAGGWLNRAAEFVEG